jgi:hypothetical protein
VLTAAATMLAMIPLTTALAISTEFPRNADVSLTTPRIARANVRRMTSTKTIGVSGNVRHSVPRRDQRHASLTMKHYKPLLSSAPANSILNAQQFHYTNSASTDIRKTFANFRRNASRKNQPSVATNVRTLTKNPLDATPAFCTTRGTCSPRH